MGDFNGDGQPDLAVANSQRQPRIGPAGQRRRHIPDQVTYAVGAQRPTPSWRATSTATAALDLAVANYATTMSRCCWATATAPSRPMSTYAVGSSPSPSWRATSTATAHRPRRRQPDANDVSVLLGNGDGTFQPQVTYAVGSDRRWPSWRATSTATAARPRRRQRRRQRRVDAPGQRRRHVPAPGHLRGGVAPDTIVAGDFNGDGRTDLAVANYGDNDVSVLLGNGDGTFQPQVDLRGGVAP